MTLVGGVEVLEPLLVSSFCCWGVLLLLSVLFAFGLGGNARRLSGVLLLDGEFVFCWLLLGFRCKKGDCETGFELMGKGFRLKGEGGVLLLRCGEGGRGRLRIVPGLSFLI